MVSYKIWSIRPKYFHLKKNIFPSDVEKTVVSFHCIHMHKQHMRYHEKMFLMTHGPSEDLDVTVEGRLELLLDPSRIAMNSKTMKTDQIGWMHRLM